jgi:DNA-binding NtrC family response regulator
MSTELVLFWLIAGTDDGAKKATEKAQRWKQALIALDGAHSKQPTCKLAIRDAFEREEAAWTGKPFVLIGRASEIESYLHHLSEEAKRVIGDCHYFWILTDCDQESLKVPLDIEERTAVVNWNHQNYNVIRSSLASLQKTPGLIGLSRSLRDIRSEIDRLAIGRKGPWTPTLILGESGTGKEEVAKSLYASIDHEESGKRKGKYKSVACGWFTAELLQDQLFGHVKGAFSGAIKDKPGVLELYSDGAVLMNDFETAPLNIQGALLGFLATHQGEPARFIRLGDDEERETWAWLMFSTNADIDELIDEKLLREDFIFRLGDRIIHIPPLRERPADMPALAHHIWTELWKEQDDLKRPLSASVLQWLLARRDTRWEGNVRALQALLSLAASMAKLPAHRHESLQRILEVIMARGPEYRHWVRLVAMRSFSFNRPLPPGDPLVQEVVELDQDFNHAALVGTGRPWPFTGSEKDAASRLNDEGRMSFKKLLAETKPPKGKLRASIRLSRALSYAARTGKIDKHTYMALSGIEETTAMSELKKLEKAGLLSSARSEDKSRRLTSFSHATIYQPVGNMFL